MKKLLLTLLIASFCSTHAASEDPTPGLATVPRTIKKQPSYQGKPGYLLLIFGDDLTQKHWLVVDGKTAYFDRNGNGDLTEAEDKIEADAEKSDQDELYFKVGDITVGNLKHQKLTFTISTIDQLNDRDDAPAQAGLAPKSKVVYLWGEFEVPGFTGRCAYGRVPRSTGPYDKDGYLILDNDPQAARIVQFGSRWSVQLDGQQKLFQGTEKDIILNVGSRGLGTGTFAKLGYEKVIPENVHPRIKLLFSKANGTGLQEHEQTLKERC